VALRIRFQYPTGARLGYSIERLADGMLYDPSDGTFKVAPANTAPANPVGILGEGGPGFAGLYLSTLATPVPPFLDGDYVLAIHDLAAASLVVAVLGATLVGGDDGTLANSGVSFASGVVAATPAPTASTFRAAGLPAGLVTGDLLGQQLAFQTGARTSVRRSISTFSVVTPGTADFTLSSPMGSAPAATDTFDVA